MNPEHDSIHIYAPKIWKNGQYMRVEWLIDFITLKSVKQSLLFLEVGEEYADFLDVKYCDCVIMGLIPYAMKNDCTIISDSPITENFRYKLEKLLMTELDNGNLDLHRIEIYAKSEYITLNGEYVGTGVSGGVDSCCSIIAHKNSKFPHFNLTHLVNFQFTNGLTTPSLKPKIATQFAKDENLPLINVCSNIINVVGHVGTRSWLHFYLFELMAIRGGFRTYHFSSTFHYSDYTSENFSNSPYPDRIECLLADVISVSGFEVICDSYFSGRYDKLKFIISNATTEKIKIAPCGIPNCGWCSECIRTLLCLDALNCLDRFDAYFDISDYLKYKHLIYIYLQTNRNELLFNQIYNILSSQGKLNLILVSSHLPTINSVEELRDLACILGSGGGHYNKAIHYHRAFKHELAFKEFCKSLDCGFMSRTTYFILSHYYRDGIVVDKNLDRAIELMRLAIECTKGVDDTVPEENELFDLLWRRNNLQDYEEMIHIMQKNALIDDVGAMGRLARMYRDGKGVEKDLNKAIELMRQAADSNILWAKNELDAMMKKMKNAN